MIAKLIPPLLLILPLYVRSQGTRVEFTSLRKD
jgi:hypothetical protein